MHATFLFTVRLVLTNMMTLKREHHFIIVLSL